MTTKGRPTKTSRILAFDLIRGYLLFVILINHLQHFPNFFDFFSGRGLLWTGAAEGFFLVSGMMVGLVRKRLVIEGQWANIFRKSWARALQLYFVSCIFTLLFTAWGQHASGNPGLKDGLAQDMSFWQLIGSTFSLRYNYGWVDFLHFNSVFLFFSPFALWMISRRKAVWLLLISLLIFLPNRTNNYCILQLYFSVGMVLGNSITDIESWFRDLPDKLGQRLKIGLYAVTILSVLASVAIDILFPFLAAHSGFGNHFLQSIQNNLASPANWALPVFDRWQKYGLGRVIVSAIWLPALYLVIRQHEKWFDKWLGWFLLPLGRNSLFIYCAEGVILFGTSLLVKTDTAVIVNFIIATLALTLTWSVAILLENYKIYLGLSKNLSNLKRLTLQNLK